MTLLVTRIAPTPSGYLHVGNAVNAVLTWWLAREAGGRLLLRIDDFDTGRARPEYLADIFATLDWLGIDVDEGPRDADGFHVAWSMATRVEQFRAALADLREAHPEVVFTCRCSRRRLSPEGRCVAGCPSAGHPLVPGESAVRLRVPEGRTAELRGPDGGRRHPVPAGDHVLWRRDDLPAYQLGSVVADVALGVNALVRGTDLLDSSALQCHLAALLDLPAFATADFRHHGLLTDDAGHKLAKSAGAQAHPLARTAALRAHVLAVAEGLGAPVGIRPPRATPASAPGRTSPPPGCG